MKKLTILFVLSFCLFTLSGCRSLREELLAPPDEMEIPEGSLVATCIEGETTNKYVYQNDGVYQYFINDIEQDEESLDSIQEQAFLHKESVQNYLNDRYGVTGCTITDYIYLESEKK